MRIGGLISERTSLLYLALLSITSCATAQIHHGTAIIAIRHANTLVIAADSLEIAPQQADTSACKIFTAGRTVFSLAGIGGVDTSRFGDIFQRDPTFARPYDEAVLQRSAARWAAGVLTILANHFEAFPQDYWDLKKNDRSTTALFAGITATGKLILVQERIHYDPARAKKFPFLVADSRIIAIDETLVMGSGSIDTYTEMRAATSSRALEARSLFLALDRPPSLDAALQTAQSFIATSENWHPEESGGDIAELTLLPSGIVWTHHTPACR